MSCEERFTFTIGVSLTGTGTRTEAEIGTGTGTEALAVPVAMATGRVAVAVGESVSAFVGEPFLERYLIIFLRSLGGVFISLSIRDKEEWMLGTSIEFSTYAAVAVAAGVAIAAGVGAGVGAREGVGVWAKFGDRVLSETGESECS